jgi:hypothetical protein
MKLEIGKRYIVTKSSDDGTFDVGDHINLLEDGCIICQEAEGWIAPNDVEEAMKGMVCEIDKEWIERRKEKITKELENLNSIPENIRKADDFLDSMNCS